MAEPVARSPIAIRGPLRVFRGWEVAASPHHSDVRPGEGRAGGGRAGDGRAGDVWLTDLSSLGKVVVRAAPGGAVARTLGVRHGRAERHTAGRLVVGSGPGEWMILSPVGGARAMIAAVVADVAATHDDELVSVIDLTHGRALIRLTGPAGPSLVAKLCAIDLSERATPDGTAFRSSVANLVTDVVRDDRAGERSYLLSCERSSGQYLFDALVDAGAELGAGVVAMSDPDELA